jgi:hypothetical protein
MFSPNNRCTIAPITGHNIYGESIEGKPLPERCSVIELKMAAVVTNSRALESGSQTHAEDLTITGKIMLSPKTAATLGARLTVAGQVLRVVALTPQYSTSGALDHYVAGCTPWA